MTDDEFDARYGALASAAQPAEAVAYGLEAWVDGAWHLQWPLRPTEADAEKDRAMYSADAKLRLVRLSAAAPKAAPASQDTEDAVLSAVKLQAQIWKQEARTQAAIVRDCYQLATDATREPGDWNGSNPVREKIVALTEARDALMAALERAYFWMDSQADTQSKGCHATFDLMMLREERDAAKAAIDAARAKQEDKP